MKTYEYKVINPSATGVPMASGGTSREQLESGLNELGREGWLYVEQCWGMMMFAREKHRRKTKQKQKKK